MGEMRFLHAALVLIFHLEQFEFSQLCHMMLDRPVELP